MALIHSAFAQARGPWRDGGRGGGEDDAQEEADDRDETEEERRRRLDREAEARRRAMADFDHLLDRMLCGGMGARGVPVALAVAHYLADRNRPDPARVLGWLRRIVPLLGGQGQANSPLAVAAAMLIFAIDRGEDGPVAARRFLLSRGVDLGSCVVETGVAPGFVESLAPGWDPASFLDAVRDAATAGEQARAYLAAARGADRRGFPSLLRSPVWDRLRRALDDPAAFARISVVERPPTSCPRCHLELDRARVEDLRRYGATHHCSLIVCTEV